MARGKNISIRWVDNRKRWCLDISSEYSMTGSRRRLFFTTEEEAEEHCKSVKAAFKEGVALSKKICPRLSNDAMNWEEKFKMYDFASLHEACSAFEEIIIRQTGAKTFGFILDSYEEERGAGWSDRFKNDRWRVFRNHLSDLDDENASFLNHDFWKSWLTKIKKERNWSPVTFNDFLGMLRPIFESRAARDAHEHNPLRDIRAMKVPSKAPAVFMVPEAKAVLACAWDNDRELVPWFAVSMFAGLRPDSEIWSLRWEHIDFEEKWIKVVAGNKTDTQRYVDLEENLITWLMPFRKDKGLVCQKSGFTKRRRKVCQGYYGDGEALVEWKHDITRHSYCSYWAAQYQDLNKLRINAGHVDLKMFEQHYKNARTKKQAAEWHKICAPSY